jgi:hypothetical protein
MAALLNGWSFNEAVEQPFNNAAIQQLKICRLLSLRVLRRG